MTVKLTFSSVDDATKALVKATKKGAIQDVLAITSWLQDEAKKSVKSTTLAIVEAEYVDGGIRITIPTGLPRDTGKSYMLGSVAWLDTDLVDSDGRTIAIDAKVLARYTDAEKAARKAKK